MDILKLVQEVDASNSAFDKHPGKQLSEIDKVHYLKGLALLAYVDTSISSEEENFIKSLIASFNLSKDSFSDLLEFAKHPSKSGITKFKSAFEDTDVKYVFIVDALFIARSDNELHKKELELIKTFYSMLNIPKQEQNVLNTILKKTTNIEDIYNLFGEPSRAKKELFDYLLPYKQKKETLELFIILKRESYYVFNKLKSKKWKQWSFDGEPVYIPAGTNVERKISLFKEELLNKLNLSYFDNYTLKILYSQYSILDLKVLIEYVFDENCNNLSVMPLEVYQNESEPVKMEILYSAFNQNKETSSIPVKRIKSKPKTPKRKTNISRIEATVDKINKKLLPIDSKMTGKVISTNGQRAFIIAENNAEMHILQSEVKKGTGRTISSIMSIGDSVLIHSEKNHVFIEISERQYS